MRNSRILCACAGALAAMALASPGIASAQSGGVGVGGGGGETAQPSADTAYYDYWFGARELRMGNAGEDVKTLNWVLRGLALGTPLQRRLPIAHRWRRARLPDLCRASPTTASCGQSTRKKLAARMLDQNASWYGPGFWGNTTACGQTLTKKMVGVAHKKLPCGTRVVFAYEGRWARAKVIDRGPFITGRKWDLTERLAKRLGTIPVGTATVKAVVAP